MIGLSAWQTRLLVLVFGSIVLLAGCGAPAVAEAPPPVETDLPPVPSATLIAVETPTPAAALPVIPLSIGEHTLQVELASTFSQRAQGLMGRTELAADQGMLFVFADDQVRTFWMKNTPLPLSIAYIDAERRIVNILDMQPYDESIYPSERPARYALEVNQGWFAERGIGAGDLVEFVLPPDLVIE